MFEPQTYAERRHRLLASLKAQGLSGLALFLGNEESPMNYADNTYPFRQDSTFLYFLGVDHAGFTGVMDLDDGTTTLFADDLSLDAIVWTGPQPSVAELAARAGIPDTAPATRLAEVLDRAKAQGRAIRFLPPYRGENRLQLQDLLGLPPAQQTGDLGLVRAVIELRARKGKEELRELALPIHTGQFKFIVFQMLPLNTGREGTGRLANSKAKQAIVLNDEWKEFRKNAIRNGFNNCDVS